MAVMTRKSTGSEELRRIGDAIDESILDASPAELREEIAALGLEADKVLAEMDAIVASAKRSCAKLRLEQAKEAVASFKLQRSGVSPIDRETVRTKLHAMRSAEGESLSGRMMAARKGKKLSDSDEEGTLDDLAQLEALENEEAEDDNE